MPYFKTTWIPRVTPLSAENLNKMEEGIRQATEKVEEFDDNKETLKKLSEQDGILMFNGNPIEGGSGDLNEENLYIDLLSALGLTPVNPNMPEVLDGGNWATTIFTYHLNGGTSW